MINKEIYASAKVTFSLVTSSLLTDNSIPMSKTLYDSPTLMEIIFS